jgi:hypothetical protein
MRATDPWLLNDVLQLNGWIGSYLNGVNQSDLRKLVILLFVSASFGSTFAQDAERASTFVEASISTGTKTFSGALSIARTHKVWNKVPNLRIGYGLRATTFVGANRFYTTAPAKYTSPVQNPFTIFSETIEENIDTISTATAFTNSVNLMVLIEYRIRKRWELGFNIDAIGFSFGPSKDFNIISSEYDRGQSPIQSGRPTTWNVLLTSDNDYGSLNSEFYLRYWAWKNFAVKTGFTFLFSEYTTSNSLSFDDGRIVNDRYRFKSGMFLISATLKLN